MLAGDHWNVGKADSWDTIDSIDRMRPGDYMAVFLVAMLVALCCAGELRDIKLCEIEVRRHGAAAPAWVRRAVVVLSAARQFALVPLVITSVPYVLFYRGSDALSLCFNAVAILFVLEIDDVVFAVWIPDATKVRVEKFRNTGLSDVAGEERLLTTTKQAHTILLSCAILFPVLLVAVLSRVATESVNEGEDVAAVTPFLAVWIGAILEARVTKQKKAEVVAGVVLGLVWIIFAMVTQHLKKMLFY